MEYCIAEGLRTDWQGRSPGGHKSLAEALFEDDSQNPNAGSLDFEREEAVELA